MLSFIFWDPPRELFSWNIPFLGRPILWYGFFFALGFFLGYFLLSYLLRLYFLQHPFYAKKEVRSLAKSFSEGALIYAVIGTVVGARLFDTLFYQDFSLCGKDPFSIFKVWEGGLASHGGAVGVFLGLFIFFKKVKKDHPKLTLYGLLDLVAIPTTLIAFCIRIGNFINQEILGVCTNVPWAIIFGHPADSSIVCPRHPVQLYEAFCYLGSGFLLWAFWRKDPGLKKQGKIFALFLIFVFGSRFAIENVKLEQSAWFHQTFLTMGQILSIPFLCWGIILLFCLGNSRKNVR